MIFKLCEHYSLNDLNELNLNDSYETNEKEQENRLEQKECFICFENDMNNTTIIDLNDQTLYIKNCSCKGIIHLVCLRKWIDTNRSCPVCRNIVIEINENIIYIPIYIKIYLCIKKIRFISSIVFLMLIYFSFGFFLNNLIITIVVELNNNIHDNESFHNNLKYLLANSSLS
jgi:hypothetical protein